MKLKPLCQSAGALLRRVQSIALYRVVGRTLGHYRLTLREATDTDKLAVHQWFNPKNDLASALQLYRKLGFTLHLIEELEPQLIAEGADSGRRRVVMRKLLDGPQ
ncbi:MAG: hypothetical protein WCI01_06470 [Chlorobiaceae bacterium]